LAAQATVVVYFNQKGSTPRAAFFIYQVTGECSGHWNAAKASPSRAVLSVITDSARIAAATARHRLCPSAVPFARKDTTMDWQTDATTDCQIGCSARIITQHRLNA